MYPAFGSQFIDESNHAVAAPMGIQTIGRCKPRGSARRADSEYIPILSPSDDSAKPASRLDAGAFMRYRLDEEQLPPKLFPSLSESPENAFANLVANIREDLAKLDVQIVAAEDVLAVVRAERGSAKSVNCEPQRL